MTTPALAVDLSRYHAGVIHFHSCLSHDGRDSLEEIATRFAADGLEFCVLTDHFEDFDAEKFARYLESLGRVDGTAATVFVPAIEAEVLGFHVIFLPVTAYAEIREIVDSGTLAESPLLKFIAHPTKHALADVTDLLRRQHLDGIELWNQQADGKHQPPIAFARALMTTVPPQMRRFFFGSDIHSVKHEISNLILIPRVGELTPARVVEALRSRDFVSYSRAADLALGGDAGSAEVTAWLDLAARRAGLKTLCRRGITGVLKFCYHLLPRPARRRINDLKNTIKNRL